MSRFRLRRTPLRLTTGAFILSAGLDKWKGDEQTAARVHGFATGTYPFLKKIDPPTFLKLLAAGRDRRRVGPAAPGRARRGRRCGARRVLRRAARALRQDAGNAARPLRPALDPGGPADLQGRLDAGRGPRPAGRRRHRRRLTRGLGGHRVHGGPLRRREGDVEQVEDPHPSRRGRRAGQGPVGGDPPLPQQDPHVRVGEPDEPCARTPVRAPRRAAARPPRTPRSRPGHGAARPGPPATATPGPAPRAPAAAPARSRPRSPDRRPRRRSPGRPRAAAAPALRRTGTRRGGWTPTCTPAVPRPSRRPAADPAGRSTRRAGRGRTPARAGRRAATPAPGSATTSTSSASALNCPARTDSCPGRPSTRNQRRCADRSRRPGLRMKSTRPFTSRAHRSRTVAARASKPGPARMNRFHGPGCSTRNQWSAGGAVPSSRSPAASAASAQRSPSGCSGTGAVTSDRREPRHLRAAAGAPARSGRPPPSPAGYPPRRVFRASARARPPP